MSTGTGPAEREAVAANNQEANLKRNSYYNACLGAPLQIEGCEVYTSGAAHCANPECRRKYKAVQRRASRNGQSVTDVLMRFWATELPHASEAEASGVAGFMIFGSIEDMMTGATSGFEALTVEASEVRERERLASEHWWTCDADELPKPLPRRMASIGDALDPLLGMTGRELELTPAQRRGYEISLYRVSDAAIQAHDLGWVRPWLAAAAAAIPPRPQARFGGAVKPWQPQPTFTLRGVTTTVVEGHQPGDWAPTGLGYQVLGHLTPTPDRRAEDKAETQAKANAEATADRAAVLESWVRPGFIGALIERDMLGGWIEPKAPTGHRAETEWDRMSQTGESKYGYPTGDWFGPLEWIAA